MTNYTIRGLPLTEILEQSRLSEDTLAPGETLTGDDGGPDDVGRRVYSGTVDNSGSLAVQRNGSFASTVQTFYGPNPDDDLGQLRATVSLDASQAFTGGSVSFVSRVVVVPITSQAPLDVQIPVFAGFGYDSTVNSAIRVDGPQAAYSLDLGPNIISRQFLDPDGDEISFAQATELDPLASNRLALEVEVFTGDVTGGYTPFPEGSRVIDGELKFGTQDPYSINLDFDVFFPTLSVSDTFMVEVDGKMVPASEVYVIAGAENNGILGVFPETIPNSLDGFEFEPHNILQIFNQTISARGTDEDGFEAGWQGGILFNPDLGNFEQVRGLTLDITAGATVTQTQLRPLALSVFETEQPVIAVVGTDVTIQNKGTVAGLVDGGAGILLASDAEASGNRIESSGTVETSGQIAPGIFGAANGIVIEQSGSVETSGVSSYGIWAVGKDLDATNDGTVETSGDNAIGAKIGNLGDRGAFLGLTVGALRDVEQFVANGLENQEAAAFLSSSNGSFVNKGTITTTAASVVANPDNNTVASLAPALFAALDNSTVANEGTLTADSVAVALIGNNLTFENSGEVKLSGTQGDGGLLESTAVLVDGINSVDISNSGTIGGDVTFVGNQGSLTNNGEIEGVLTAGGGIGMMGSASGEFELTTGAGSMLGDDQTVSHVLGLIGDDGNLAASKFDLTSAGTILGGLRVLAGQQSIKLTDSNAKIQSNGVTALDLVGNVTAVLDGTIQSTGAHAFTVNELDGSSLDLTINSEGNVTAQDGNGVTAVIVGNIAATNDGTVTVIGSEARGFNLYSAAGGSAALINSGTIDASGSATGIRMILGTVTNSGTVTATGPSARGVEVGGTSITNSGSIIATGTDAIAVFGNSALLPLDGLNLTLVNTGRIAGQQGADAIVGSVFGDRITNSGSFEGDVRLGPGNDILTWQSGATTTSAIDAGTGGMDEIVAEGGFIDGSLFLNFERLKITGDVLVDGLLDIDTATVESGTLTLSGVIDGDVEVQDGAALLGAGVIKGNLTAEPGSFLGPGFSPGKITVEGDATIGGQLLIEIDGPSADQLDVIEVLGTLDLTSADILVRFADTYQPEPDTTFSIFDADSVVGLDPASVTIEGLPSGSTLSFTEDGNASVDAADPGNTPPVATNDAVTTGENTIARINVLANDTDPDGDPLTLAGLNDDATLGTVFIDQTTGEIVFDPGTVFDGLAQGDIGFDTLSYDISDGQGGSDTATVTIEITGQNDAPDAIDDRFDTEGGVDLILANNANLANDTDIDGDDLIVTDVGTAANGIATLVQDGTITYTPNAGFVGTDTFTYTIADQNGGTDSAVITVDVGPISNSPPIVTAIAAGFGEDDVGKIVNLLDPALVFDPDGDDLKIANVLIDGDDLRGLDFNADPETGLLTLADDQFDDLAGGERFTVSLRYDVTDGIASIANTATITVEGANDDPVAVDDAGAGFSTKDDIAFTTANVLTNDTDIDGDALSIVAVDTAGTLGLITDNGDGTFGYDPNGAFSASNGTATDRFTYTISDQDGATSTATVEISIESDGPTPALNEVIGTDTRDVLIGTVEGDLILGKGGNDRIYAKAGDDRIDPGSGKDWTVFGGAGADTFLFGLGSDVIKIGDFQSGVDLIELGDGLTVDDLRIIAGSNAVNIFTPDGDRLILSNLAEITEADFGFGASANVIEGTDNPFETLLGTDEADDIIARGGSDRIFAKAGDDRIDAGSGNDWTVFGGAGSDTFVFNLGSQNTRIQDFEDGLDLIELGEGLTFADLTLSFSAATGATNIFSPNGDRFILSDTDLSEVTEADFV
ncbi:MAG: tandem-95 repeat protein [Pseudomonadota bacterium]